LDVEAKWRANENAGNIKAPYNAMKFCETLAKAIGELHRPEQKSASAHNSMGQEIPLEGINVSPLGIFAIEKEALVVRENVSDH
jgi:hypothetical protein